MSASKAGGLTNGALSHELSFSNVVAFVAEAIQGKGVYLAPDGFCHEAQGLCCHHGALLVIDAV